MIDQPLFPVQNPYTRVPNGTTNGLTNDQASRIAKLFQVAGFNVATGFSSGNTSTNMVAMQMAVWNVMYDTDYTISAGSFQLLTDNNAGVRALANSWLTAIQTMPTANTPVERLVHATGQDLIFQNCVSAEPGTCDAGTNMYSVTGHIFFTNAPATGTLTVSIGSITQTFTAPFTSPQAYTLSGLSADGASHTVTAVFSAVPACSSTATYTAPASCAPTCTATQTHTTPVCNNNSTAGNATDDWFSFSVTGTVANGSGNYVVKIGSWTSPSIVNGQSVSIVGNGLSGNPSLPANGSSITVRVEDAVTSTCFATFTVSNAACSSCPTPNCGSVTVQKN
jgi:hypothetical protein